MHAGDLVEVISISKNGKPLKSKEKALLQYSTGSRIKLCNLYDETIIGYRNSENICLVD